MTKMRLISQPLPKDFQETLIEKLRSSIFSILDPVEVILFGSAARGEMTEVSDLDVIVIVETVDVVKQTYKALGKLTLTLGWPVDLLVIDEESFLRKSEIGGVYQLAREEGRSWSEKAAT